MNKRTIVILIIAGLAAVSSLAAVCGGGDDAIERPPTPTLAPTPVVGYWHEHCARIRNDGGCDRRFRPIYHDRHFHRETYPPHSEGNHY